jgi:hypothetical protein
MKKWIKGLLLLSAYMGMVAPLHATSVELWPSDRRRNNTLYCYGNDWNMFYIRFYSDKWLSPIINRDKYKKELPNVFSKDTLVIVTLPRATDFLGVFVHTESGMSPVHKELKTELFSENGKNYSRLYIPLDTRLLNMRLHSYYYDIYVWYEAPEFLDDTIRWTLVYDGETLAEAQSRLRTAGVVQKDRKFPKRFHFHPYDAYTCVPDDNFDRIADFYKRFGIDGILSFWSYGLSGTKEMYHKMLQTHQRFGIRNIAKMNPFCDKYTQNLATAHPKMTDPNPGLVAAMDNACKGIESDEAKQEWKDASRYFDMALYDWEPEGPQTWPGYEDTACIAAFSRTQGLDTPIAPELIKTKYRQAYARFRMEQTARPLYSLQKTINTIKPIPLIIEQGDGSARNIDYNVYGNDFDILRPMTYKTSPQAYARDVLEMLDNTSIPSKKFMPDLTIGWNHVGPFRESPEEFLLDTMMSAAAGLGGIGHWPEMYQTDGALFGIHEGLARIALVEDFYFEGQPVDTVSVSGIPYREKTIDLGSRKLTFYAPDWRPVLLSFVHRLKTDYLVTILNYHAEQDAFVEIRSPELKNHFLVDPVEKVYCVCDEAGRAVVRVGSESPALWIATTDAARTADCRRIDPAAIRSQLEFAKKQYLKTNPEGEVQTGQTGSIRIEYDQIDFNGMPSTCLRVKTPSQTIFFGESGGRIYQWRVPDVPFPAKLNDQSSDGIGMDLLWLPENGRWSGDEVAPMILTLCQNDGRSARVVYEGEFKKGYPGIKLRKAYTVPATGTTLTVDVTLINTLSGPAKLSYWQHNMFHASTFDFIVAGAAPFRVASGHFIAPARDLPESLRPYVLAGGTAIPPTDPVFAQYFPDSRAGLVFRLPKEFMNIYFCSSPKQSFSTSEWMSRPLTIPAGRSRTLRYSMTAIPGTSVEALRDRIK